MDYFSLYTSFSPVSDVFWKPPGYSGSSSIGACKDAVFTSISWTVKLFWTASSINAHTEVRFAVGSLCLLFGWTPTYLALNPFQHFLQWYDQGRQVSRRITIKDLKSNKFWKNHFITVNSVINR